jgi:hypothetical protein
VLRAFVFPNRNEGFAGGLVFGLEIRGRLCVAGAAANFAALFSLLLKALAND